jgi:5-aminolevulinate synthase
LRITPTPFHDEALIVALVRALSAVWKKLDLPFASRAEAAE